MISYRQLVTGKEYYIKSYEGLYFKGMKFHDYQTSIGDLTRDALNYHINLNMIFIRNTYFYLFHEKDYYYDPEIIREKAQLARQCMEQRSLNMILKRVVNEEFQWS
jgi:hypothetical protein